MSSLSSLLYLHALLQRSTAHERSDLWQYLSFRTKQLMESIPPSEGDPIATAETDGDMLRYIHFSWIAPFLRTLPEREIGLFLAALEPTQSSLVGKELLYTKSLPVITNIGKSFLQKTLLRYLTAEKEDLLSRSCLPVAPLNELLTLPDEALGKMFDFLGLHDLALEVRQIIEKQRLQAIYDTLSPSQRNYLQRLHQAQESIVFPQMGLANWDGNPEKLRSLIRQRGGNRLAKALYGQDESLIWYVLHKLDVESALLVKRLLTPIDHYGDVVPVLTRQIIELVEFSRRKDE